MGRYTGLPAFPVACCDTHPNCAPQMAELKEELNNVSKDKVKGAVKRVIAAMMIGKDVSVVFMEMLKCMQTTDLELKKLVYLYLINYARSQPELAIMAVNSFVNDTRDPSPLVQALALRTMACIHVDKISEYLCDPLAAALKDADPYVRKTAAVCVLKLFDMNAELVEEQGYIQALLDLLADPNQMVVTNVVAALSEMSATKPCFTINSGVVNKLLNVLNEATAWGQVYVLDALANYRPIDPREAEQIMDRVSPRLQHETSSVVLSTVRLIMLMMGHVSPDTVTRFAKKLAPPMVSLALLHNMPEVQYVALLNIKLILQKLPGLLNSEFKVFFCKYNDPLYVKMEKLDLIVQIVSQANGESVLAELKEYAQEVDVEFVRKSIRSIGLVAIKIEGAAERCVQILLELIETKINYVVQEGIVVIKDIFRKYPNRYESIIANLCDALDTLDEPEARAALIWIVGEYSDRIENADELLEQFLETFHEEPAGVQLQLLTAVVKLFLHKTDAVSELLQQVLHMATQDSGNPDLRDRGFIYWRLLSQDVEAAKLVVMSEKPVISAQTGMLDPTLLDELISNLGTLSSVYRKPPVHLIADHVQDRPPAEGGVDEADQQYVASEDYDDKAAEEEVPAPDVGVAEGDLLNMGTPRGGGGGGGSLLDLIGPPAAMVDDKPLVLPADKTGGLQINAEFRRSGGSVVLDVTLAHMGEPAASSAFSNLHVQFNKNACGLKPRSTAIPVQAVPPGQRRSAEIALVVLPEFVPPQGSPCEDTVQCALKLDGGNGQVQYFRVPFSLATLCVEDGRLDKALYLSTWRSIPNESEVSRKVVDLCVRCQSTDNVIDLLESCNIFNTARRHDQRGSTPLELLYASMRTVHGVTILIEFTFPRGGGNVCKVAVRTGDPPIIPLVVSFIERLLKTAQT